MTYRSTTEALLHRIRDLEDHGGCTRCAAAAAQKKNIRAAIGGTVKVLAFTGCLAAALCVVFVCVIAVSLALSGEGFPPNIH